MVFVRRGHRQGPKRGDLTGPNPTDRGKSGVKRSVITDAEGIPIGVVIAGANIHDKHLVEPTLDQVGIRGARGPRRPVNLCLDKGFDYKDTERSIRKRGITPHIRRRGEPPLIGCVRGRPRRWVVERTNSWHNNFRALKIRWEVKGCNHQALVFLACALITFNRLL